MAALTALPNIIHDELIEPSNHVVHVSIFDCSVFVLAALAAGDLICLGLDGHRVAAGSLA